MNNRVLRNITFSTITLILSLTSQLAVSGDVEAGRIKATVCNHCHQDNNDTSIPKIAGQHENYLIEQMKAYRSGQRKDEIMETVVNQFKNESDIYDLAAYFSSLPAIRDQFAKRQNPLGHEVFKDKIGCYQCHGENGEGNPSAKPIIPSIAGQNKDYIVKRLMEFQSQRPHRTQNNPMPIVAKKLDIVDVFSVSEYVNGLQ